MFQTKGQKCILNPIQDNFKNREEAFIHYLNSLRVQL